MEKDKYKAVWISYSALSDFIACPRAYFYAYIYKNPRSGRKITIMNPALALGQAVHDALEKLSRFSVEERFSSSLEDSFEKSWEVVSGQKGGFKDKKEEDEYFERGHMMIKNVMENPGPLRHKAIKIKQDLPHYWLSEEEEIILCGKIDWIEYLPDTDSLHIIDFKTGRRTEKEDSLQLPIYYLLVTNCQNRIVEKMSYWYLDRETSPHQVQLPQKESAENDLMKIALRIKLARQLNHFKCAQDEKFGCRNCAPYEAAIKGKGIFVGLNQYDREIYVLSDEAIRL